MIAGEEIRFVLFGMPHIAAMVLTVVVAVSLVIVVRKYPGATKAVCIAFAAALVLNDVIYMIHGAFETDAWGFVRNKLPLHVCDVAVYFLAVAMLTRSRFAYETAWFWGTAGTVQAVITPDLDSAFPAYYFFHYFIAHSGVVAGALFATWGLRMRPGKWSVLRVFIVSNLFMLLLAVFNQLTGSNYMFICMPPAGASPFFFLPWPWYILFLEGVGLVSFIIVYLPFPISDRLGDFFCIVGK
jgi:hypothetical integral membrane protein (TIGR02206 family)